METKIKNNFIVKLGLVASTFFVTMITTILALIITYISHYVTNSSIDALDFFVSVFAPILITPPVIIIYGSFTLKILKLEQEKENLETYDQLTGVLTRRALINSAVALANLAERDKKSISFIYCDLDMFKKINDKEGHEAGDIILKESGYIFNSIKRKSDVCGRIGGEEFLIILPNTEASGALVFAEKLKKAFLDKKFIFNKSILQMTISIGISDSEKSNTYNIDKIISDADNSLKEAKKAGGNRITIYSPVES